MSLVSEKCVVCDENPRKYKCPRCEISTCSLKCVDIHKSELKCSGIREKTGYVSLKKFDNLCLLSDYRFLEDIDRFVDNCRRNPQKRFTRFKQPLPTFLYRLKAAAEKRAIYLQFLPQHFTRHRENKTIFKYDSQLIHWKIDFIFPQGEVLKISEVVPENRRLSKVLDKFINFKTCPEMYKDLLRCYHASGLSDIEVLLKAERVRQQNSFYLLDLNSTVGKNLVHRIIVENPIIFVIRKAFKDEYNILVDTALDGNPFGSLQGKKSGFFGDFTPVGQFDELNPRIKIKTEGEAAMEDILSIAAELRVKKEVDDDDVSDFEDLPSARSFHIPSYDDLCSQNVK